MTRKKRTTYRGKWLRRSGITLLSAWATTLIVFFSDPAGTKLRWHKTYNWLTNKQFKPPKKALPCSEHATHAWMMDDRTEHYWEHSCQTGIEPLRFVRDIDPTVAQGKLVAVLPTDLYHVDTMRYSFPFAVPKARDLIDTIATRFQQKLDNTDLAGTKLTVTSVLRTHSSVKRLMRHNRNAIRNSAHLHGTTFDISYATYTGTRAISATEADYLKEILAETLFELREEKKCWVTYEIFQTCFHIVAR